MADELRIEPEPTSRLGVRLRAQGAGRRATAAIVAGAVGLGAFVASLLQPWLRISVTFQASPEVGDIGVEDSVSTLGPDAASFNVVYQLGVLALLALLASVVLRPNLAARLRLAAVGLGLGVAGVAVATLFQLRGYVDVLGLVTAMFDAYTVSNEYLPGFYCAGGAVVALVAGVWLAAAPGTGVTAASSASGERPASGLARLVGGQATAVGIAAGIAGAGAFVASMLVTWQRIEPEGNGIIPGTNEPLINLGLPDTGSGVVFLLGALALVGLLGAVATRPDLAARLRPAASGIGLGLAAVLVATIFEMRHWMLGRYGALGAFAFSDDARRELDRLTYTFQPGIYLGFGAIVVLVAGVWLVAAPAAAPVATAVPVMAYAAVPEGYVLVPASSVLPVPTSPVPDDGPEPAGDTQPTGAPGLPAQPPAPAPVSGPAATWLGPVGYADGLTVMASDPIDIGNQSDILRS